MQLHTRIVGKLYEYTEIWPGEEEKIHTRVLNLLNYKHTPDFISKEFFFHVFNKVL